MPYTNTLFDVDTGPDMYSASPEIPATTPQEAPQGDPAPTEMPRIDPSPTEVPQYDPNGK